MKEKNSPKVLIVDDLQTNVELLQAYLEEEGYTILTASNGKMAIEIAQEELPDIILLDVIMPVMDGYEACHLIKENKATKNIPVVMVTSLNEVSSRIAGIEAGADDFLSKPFNIYELLARVKSLIRIKQYNYRIIEQNRIFQKELEIAEKVQKAILPDKSLKLNGITLHYEYIPCQSLGGDYVNFIELADNRVGIFLADVMGHGVAASLITMVLKTLFDNLAYQMKTPSDFLFALNNGLHAIFGEILIYATAIYVIIDLKNKRFYAANGGHPAGLLFNPNKPELEELHSKGTILGIFKDTQYTDYIKEIEPNDQFLLYTDGLTDVQDEADNEFGEAKLYDIVSRYKNLAPKPFIESILNEIYQFANVETFTDDINMISFKLDT